MDALTLVGRSGGRLDIVGAICLPMLCLGDHWPSDIVAGALVGVALMLLLWPAYRRHWATRSVLRFSATQLPVFYAIAWLLALEIEVRFGDVQAYSIDAARLARALLS